ncbi:ROK family protein [Halalkalicoccus jeotgali]|uniref:Glucokinase n=1 Tax=Halalkalicoccus jeotgali (strain DSM 18796 / CECT 7217 / JCM 14584 / KCTC 4019 / B3) TaxID=795797 RepID=D8J9R3_HALJB|nr:ROK family protein [Halalkalicoccus jeotgali]ADJ16402.1 glucokinase [Halalkalicoccus jeotgali B3]ELY37136.1 glucokinase [Halalkalicoccus jeotgali B3]
MAHYAGVDLGATNIRAAVADGEAEILAVARRETPQGPTGIDVTEAVLRALRAACEEATVEPHSIAAAGIGSFGPFDLAAGTIENPANLPDTVETIPLTGPVEKLIDSEKVYLHNDTIAGVIGERFHSDRNPDDMVYLTISSGIGAGVCVDGNVLSGWDGNAGEVGHMTIDPEGLRTCGCGHDGHWEAYCSGNNIPKYARLLYRDAQGMDTTLPIADPDFSAVDVFEYAAEDDFARYVVEQVGHWNAMGVANIVHAYAPLVVYVGGAVAINNPELTLDPIREKLEEMVFVNIPQIELTTLGDDVVLHGAIASAMTGGTGDRARMRS